MTEHTEHTADNDACLACGLPDDYCTCALIFDRPWRLDLQCCGRHVVTEFFADWGAAERFRESYCTGGGVDPHGYSGDGYSGHQRAGIITDARVIPSAETERVETI